MKIHWEKNNALQRRAAGIMPLGVNSNFRYWGEGITPYMQRAKGAYLWDADGNRYIDYRLAFGPIILGHADEEVNAKVKAEIDLGTMAAMTYELEIEVVEKIIRMCPGVEMVRLACSGTEATMHALRVARAYTGREKIIKFEGCYHGMQDYALWSTYAPSEAYGNTRSPISVPASSGIPRPLNELIITLPFNDREALELALRSEGERVAAIITEPCMGNCGAINARNGFLELIREQCTKYGIVFILDEVKTGFRIANGGALEVLGIRPDMVTWAKALANGYPLAAFGGKKEIMSLIGHGVIHGGTFTNNKPGVAAAWATLTVLEREPVLKTIEKRGTRLMEGIRGILTEASLPFCMSGFPSMFSYAIGIEDATDQRTWNKSDKKYFLELVEAMVQRGVMLDHDPREPIFMCYAHSEADVDMTLDVFRETIRSVKP